MNTLSKEGRTRNRTRRWASAAGMAAALLTAQIAVQAAGQLPASALAGAVVVTELSESTSDSPKVVSAFCPEGRRVTGGSGRIIGGAGRVVLTRMRPVHTNNLDRFEVAAAEDERGLAARWSVQAYVICADPIAGQEIVEFTVDADEGFRAVFATANCPGGKRAVGGGGRIAGGQGQVQLGHSMDTVSGTAHFAAGVVDADGPDTPWSVTAYAVCASLSAAEVIPVRRTSVRDPISPKSETATCPAGMRVSGAGGSATVGTPNVAFQSIVPEIGAGNVPGDTVTVTARETNPTDEVWDVQATAYCVT